MGGERKDQCEELVSLLRIYTLIFTDLCRSSEVAHIYSQTTARNLQMSQPTYAITGIQDGRGPSGSVPIRYEISKFADPKFNPHAADHLNLFLQALERIQKAPRTELLSWFQIGGVHFVRMLAILKLRRRARYQVYTASRSWTGITQRRQST